MYELTAFFQPSPPAILASSSPHHFALQYCSPGGSEDNQDSACSVGDPGLTLGKDDTLEKEMATHSSILAWRIPWTEELVGYSPQCHKE